MPRLIMICGLPGTGKSGVARYLAGKLEAVILRTDEIRKEMFSDKEYFRYGTKNLSPEKEREAVYEEMFKRMTNFLNQDKNVILDATFHKESLRKKVRNLAEKAGVKLEIIEVTCPEWLVKKGMTERVQKKQNASTAGFEIHLKYKKIFEPITEKHLTIDTFKDWMQQLEKILK